MLGGTSTCLTYRFQVPDSCNMCGAGRDRLHALGMRLNKGQGFKPKQMTGIAVGVRQCDDCALIFADPQPEPERFDDHYGDSDEYWHEEYFRDDPAYFATEIADAKSLIGRTERPKAL